MKKDTKEALDRLQEELLASDRPTTVIPSADDILADQELRALLEDKPRPRSGTARNTDRTEVSAKKLSKKLEKPEKKSLKGLMVTALLLTLGILAVLCFWLVRYVGILR